MEIDTTIVTEHIVKGILLKPTFIMSVDGQQRYSGKVIFPVSNGTELVVEIKPEEWNTFWSNFSNGKYLLEVLKAEYDLSTLVIPSDIETWFNNMV